uniref:CSON009853 protein n=1 Tax=Culicoides sonorensis TaxID=179676 RepID=A0A336M133_CULSO
MNLCRACRVLERKIPHQSIFELNLDKTYENLTQIQLSLNSSNNFICSKCINLLQSFEKFRSTCIESHKYFEEQEFNQISIKILPESPCEQIEFQKVLIEEIEIKEEVPEIETLIHEHAVNGSIKEIEIEKNESEQKLIELPDQYNECKSNEKEEKARKRENGSTDNEKEVFNLLDHQKKIYVCSICKKMCKNSKSLTDHKTSHREGRYLCHYCGFKAKKKKYILSHIQSRHIEKDYGRAGDFACDLCERRYLTQFRLDQHKPIHKIVLSPCPICAKLVKNINTHIKAHENPSQRFTCDECGRSYKTESNLIQHKIVHQNKIFACKVCGREFNAPPKLQQHMRIHKPDRQNIHVIIVAILLANERNFICTVCSFAFKNPSALKKHMHIHNNTKPYMCKICDFDKTYENLTQIQLSLNSSNNFICSKCINLLKSFEKFRSTCIESHKYFEEQEFNEISIKIIPESPCDPIEFQKVLIEEIEIKEEVPEIETHINDQPVNGSIEEIKIEKNEGEQKPKELPDQYNECKVKEKEKMAGKKENGSSDNEKEIFNLLDHQKKIFVCSVCKKMFRNRKALTNHKIYHKEGRYICHYCGFKAKMKRFILSHIQTRHIEKDYGRVGDYACDLCDRRYLTQYRLDQHKPMHKIVLSPCPICAKLVRNINTHIRAHENPSQRFTCDECGRSYKSESNLIQHKIVHQNKIFACKVCGREFNAPQNLQQHMRIHKPDRRTYPCNHCSHVFTFKSALNLHLRMLTNERNFICTVCSFAFKTSLDLKRHMHIHNNTKPFMCKDCNFGSWKKHKYLDHLKTSHS